MSELGASSFINSKNTFTLRTSSFRSSKKLLHYELVVLQVIKILLHYGLVVLQEVKIFVTWKCLKNDPQSVSSYLPSCRGKTYRQWQRHEVAKPPVTSPGISW